ncbi:hypothetical protein FB556_0239 [Enteractinococcus coprophilus]|uniref:Uncharacterized protein n=1 Tax=Enteractinococcus coprophilus TaxID=1027633 RepID=A0A543AMI5_9MICC|nr:hypothetical protein FB556_0239 [Enteractinococcus coprophilus]
MIEEQKDHLSWSFHNVVRGVGISTFAGHGDWHVGRTRFGGLAATNEEPSS